VTRRVRVEEVVRFLEGRFLEGEGETVLAELRREGLFEGEELSPAEAEELRVAVSLMRELDVNPAGVDVALHLRRRLLFLEDRMRRLLRELGAWEPGMERSGSGR